MQFHLKQKLIDFIGKENLIKRKENPQKKLVGLELIGKEKANHGDCVHIGRAQVGIVTSACLSPTLGKNIALCRIDVGHSEMELMLKLEKLMVIKKEFQLNSCFPSLMIPKNSS